MTLITMQHRDVDEKDRVDETVGIVDGDEAGEVSTWGEDVAGTMMLHCMSMWQHKKIDHQATNIMNKINQHSKQNHQHTQRNTKNH